MLRCWSLETSARPSFRQIADEIQGFKTLESEEMEVDEKTPLQQNMTTDDSAELV